MRQRDLDRKLFNRGHWEVVAAQFRTKLAPDMEVGERAVLVDLAIALAKRFSADNSEFDPVQFLNRCSPNEELYPIGELWQGVNVQEMVEED